MDTWSHIFHLKKKKKIKIASNSWHAISAAQKMKMDQSHDITCTKPPHPLTMALPGKPLIQCRCNIYIQKGVWAEYNFKTQGTSGCVRIACDPINVRIDSMMHFMWKVKKKIDLVLYPQLGPSFLLPRLFPHQLKYCSTHCHTMHDRIMWDTVKCHVPASVKI